MGQQRRFTGRQITTMVVVGALAVVLAPAGVWAATTGSAVNVTDPVSGSYKAHVTSLGQLLTSIGDPTSGVKAKVNSSGQQLIYVANAPSVHVNNFPGTQQVNGTVTTVPGVPGTPFTNSLAGSVSVPAGKHLVVETVSAQIDVNPQVGTTLEAFVAYTSGGVGGNLFLPLTYAYTDSSTGYAFYAGTTQVKLYADPGSTLTLSAALPSGTLGSEYLNVSGYLA